MSRMFSLRLFAVYLLFTPDIPADGTYSLSPILTSVLFPTRSCQIYFNHVDQKTQPHPTFLQFDEIQAQKSHHFRIQALANIDL